MHDKFCVRYFDEKFHARSDLHLLLNTDRLVANWHPIQPCQMHPITSKFRVCRQTKKIHKYPMNTCYFIPRNEISLKNVSLAITLLSITVTKK